MDLVNISLGVILPILVIQFILMLVALIDCIRNEKTNGPKLMWVLIIILVNLFGPILYFVIGRRND